MMSFKSLIGMEEGRPGQSGRAAGDAAGGGQELSSWLSDYNRSRQSISTAASSSVSGLFSSLSSSSSSSSSSPSPLPNPDATSSSSISSSWLPWSTAAAETASLTASGSASSSSASPASASSSAGWWPLSSSASSSSASSPSSSSSWSGLVGWGVEDAAVCCGLSWSQRLALFFLCSLGGLAMLGLSFTFLSLLFLGQSAKFSMSYALANCLFLLSSAFVTGWQQQLASMFHPSRALLSALYLLSLLLLLLCAWQLRVFYVLLPLLLLQVSCLLLYVASYLPFGLPVMKRLLGVFLLSMKRLMTG